MLPYTLTLMIPNILGLSAKVKFEAASGH